MYFTRLYNNDPFAFDYNLKQGNILTGQMFN
jgi:hypothetical protein